MEGKQGLCNNAHCMTIWAENFTWK